MGSQESLAGDPTLLPNPHREHVNVTTSASTMERILSDDRIAVDSSSTQHATNPFIYQQQQVQNPYNISPQQQFTPFVANNQAYQPNCNAYAYNQPLQPQAQQVTIPIQQLQSNPQQQLSQNVPLPNSTPQQLKFELQQQMHQLHMWQQAQQLERQRLDLARLQMNLDVQLQSQQRQQHELQLQIEREQQAQIVAAADTNKVEKHKVENREEEIYPTVFHWSHGGRVVYVAYSGDNWSHKYRMHRSHNDFSLIMEIKPGVYHYKFIVDNQWRVARNQKHVRDANGAYSNVLDVRSHSYQRVIDEKENKRKREKQKAQYHTNLPLADHYVQDPPICPIHLHNVVLNNNDNEDEDDDGLGNDEHIDVQQVSIVNKRSVNTMQVPKPLRVSLNHLYVSDNREEEVVTLGMTERYKDKFFTTVYYTPIQRVVERDNYDGE